MNTDKVIELLERHQEIMIKCKKSRSYFVDLALEELKK